MSVKLSLEIKGLRDDEDVLLYGHGIGLDDPGEPAGMQPPDDPGQPAGMQPPDDPGGPAGMQPPDDPGGPAGMQPPDDPWGCGPRAYRLAGGSGSHRPASSVARARAAGAPYSGSIVVRLSKLVPHLKVNSLQALAEDLGLDGLCDALKRFGNPDSERVITTPNAGDPGEITSLVCPVAKEQTEDYLAPAMPKTLSDLERQAARSDLRPLHSLWSYWRVDAGSLKIRKRRFWRDAPANDGLGYSTAELAQSLVKQLGDLAEVDLAYRERAVSDPTPHVDPSPEELSDFQFYLDRSPLGLDARWAWLHLNGTPDDEVRVADLEQGWIPGHEDLPALPNVLGGNNRHDADDEYVGDHGTAVLSQLMARKGNKQGVMGIATGAGQFHLASHYCSKSKGGGTNGHVANAIAALISGETPTLKAGDVLLLEVQRGLMPTEWDPADFDAIRTASANGIIVVEAAGNGGFDLDRLETDDGRSFSRRSSGFLDSGAIMVGASQATVPHDRASFSNYGSRLDCFAWGSGVVAAGYGNYFDGDDVSESYTDTFSGTSSASPMIAGAAVVIQNLYRANAGQQAPVADPESWKRLSPRQMRSLLSDPGNGTRQGQGLRGYIGVMPDLRAVLEQALEIVPQVYLQDHEGDTGQTPYAQRICASPDIVVTSATAGKQICVRLRNRGLKTAKRAGGRLYSAPVSVLVTPDDWEPVGEFSADGGVVPQGDTPVDSHPVAWSETEDRCLIAVAEYEGSTEVPVRCHPSNFHWQRYLTSLREQGNIALRNVHEKASAEPLEFTIKGTPDAPRRFRFEVIQRLPAGVNVEMSAQVGLVLKLIRGRLWKTKREAKDRATLYLPKQPRLPLASVTLPPGVCFRHCRLQLTGDVAAVEKGHSLAIRQLYRGQEVGRITWRFS